MGEHQAPAGVVAPGSPAGGGVPAVRDPLVAGIGLTYWLLLGEWDFYYYLNVQPARWWIAVAIVGALVAAYLALAAWLYVRWRLSIRFLLFERASPREALRKSWHQTRGRFRELAFPLAVVWLVVLVASSVMTWLISVGAARLLDDRGTLVLLIPVVVGTLALGAVVDLMWFIIWAREQVLAPISCRRRAASCAPGPAYAA